MVVLSGYMWEIDFVATLDPGSHFLTEREKLAHARRLVFLLMPEKIKIAAEVEFGGIEGYQTAASESILEGQSGYAAYAKAGFHCAFDGLCVFQLQTYVELCMMILKGAVKRLARARAFFPQYPGLI